MDQPLAASAAPDPIPAPPAAKKPGGCASGGCSTGSCNMMNSHDWLQYEGIADLYPKTDLVEVRFKGGRKDFFRNVHDYGLVIGDAVVTECATGYHVGYVALAGPMVELQMRKKKVRTDSPELLSIFRKAAPKDLEKLAEARNRELPTLFRTRQIVDGMKLDMKLSDVEYQADGTKATFYYSSDQRVDFRELVRVLASEFKIRVDMRQISLRQEAGRLGGIGVCGRELCCSTWLTDFKSVNTSAARYQNLSLNPQKLAGQCGRLKCCLNYELETYITEMAGIPKVEKPLQTGKGDAFLQKTDIFRKRMWFNYRGETNWFEVPIERVHDILALNAEGQRPLALTEAEEADMRAPDEAVPINSDLRQLDEKYRNKERNRRDERRRQGQQAPRGQQAARPRPDGPPRPAGPAQPDRQNPKVERSQSPRPDGPQGEARGPRPEGQGGRNRNRRNRPRPGGGGGGKPPGGGEN